MNSYYASIIDSSIAWISTSSISQALDYISTMFSRVWEWLFGYFEGLLCPELGAWLTPSACDSICSGLAFVLVIILFLFIGKILLTLLSKGLMKLIHVVFVESINLIIKLIGFILGRIFKGLYYLVSLPFRLLFKS